MVSLSVLLFDDERPDVVPGLLVVFGVGSVAVRELQAVRTHNVRKTKVVLIKFTPFVLNGGTLVSLLAFRHVGYITLIL